MASAMKTAANTTTIEVDMRLASGAAGRAAVPSGASTGTREALSLNYRCTLSTQFFGWLNGRGTRS